jgi:MOSC domain-containing protein YiiM
MSAYLAQNSGPFVLSVNISPGGIPKRPIPSAEARKDGLEGDGRNHAKHVRPDRAVSLWDYEMLRQIAAEGFESLSPGAAGENLTVKNLNLHAMSPGTLLKIGDAILKLEMPRKPCYVLDAIDPRLKEVVVGRLGFLAAVVHEGTIQPGMPVEVLENACLEGASGQKPEVSGPGIVPLLNPESRTLNTPLLAAPTIG